MKQLDFKIFPSPEKTIFVEDDPIYDGAHTYEVINSLGFAEGRPVYADSTQTIRFVKANEDGSMVPGLQSEQLAYILLDRCKKLNARFPSGYNERMIDGLEMFLQACRERVEERMTRNIMGKLVK